MKRARWNGDLVDLLRWKTLGTSGMERSSRMRCFAQKHGLTYAAASTRASAMRATNDPSEKDKVNRTRAPRPPVGTPLCYVCKRNRTQHKQHRMCVECRSFYASAA